MTMAADIMVRNTALDTDPRSMMTRKEVTTRNTTEKDILRLRSARVTL